MPAGTVAGQMNYYNGTAWITIVPTANDGAHFTMTAGVPSWTVGTPRTPATIGDFRDGGVVFWVDPEDNTYGLVCAIEDQSSGIQWYNGNYTTTGATGTAIGTGSANTTAIIANQGTTETAYAAGLARAYNGGGYTDWFLPSKDELNQMYENKAMINSTATANSGSNFTNNYYWSSTEYDAGSAWLQSFNNGDQANGGKSNTVYVRAVRAF
jgi:hypothetical protein